MKEKLEYLNKYHKNVCLINENVDLLDEIPKKWKSILNKTTLDEKIKDTISIWEENIFPQLSNTINYLKNNLVNIELIKYGERYSLLYSIKSKNNRILYYEGILSNIDINKLKIDWTKVPEAIKRFYENIHNGFFYYASESMGLVPIEGVKYFGEDEWGILDELEEDLGINLETTFATFNSGMGGYVATDLNNCDNDNATVWFTSSQPTYKMNFWDVVDEWIVIGFE
ncbi:hypothetical protein CM240_0228 [Clostridium bornimense]|uniref:SMI1/KNR4 family protein n=1 Tax=Clostridium bornimense TaxID=1216932 RepID=W6RT31_9CLOT|nr:hypothetical protein [Clostridium bornimense]CDM67398.1 hypothetical protein CM240_0228 [Clostridium bornimense]